MEKKHWLAVAFFVILMVIMEIILECPAFGASYQRKGHQAISFELDDETSDIILSDLDDDIASVKKFEDTILIWYTDSEGKLAAIFTLTPEEFKQLKVYSIQYILNKK